MDYTEYREKIHAANEEIRILKAQLEGNELDACRYLQAKADRQGAALDKLNRRVVTQRFQLRSLNEMGRGLSKEEWLELKAKTEDETRNSRVDELMFVV